MRRRSSDCSGNGERRGDRVLCCWPKIKEKTLLPLLRQPVPENPILSLRAFTLHSLHIRIRIPRTVDCLLVHIWSGGSPLHLQFLTLLLVYVRWSLRASWKITRRNRLGSSSRPSISLHSYLLLYIVSTVAHFQNSDGGEGCENL
ncbi:hypothetical protein NE237_004406 [Protea cynaroides]|uniref:Uncharacterized protein n=1 Tax=Protea cynaroides TaxID=273540 RepID=A0A9Q0QTK1_9MAGN|nr:hypothetical protein NE237_004406 [Protea cynaroides]